MLEETGIFSSEQKRPGGAGRCGGKASPAPRPQLPVVRLVRTGIKGQGLFANPISSEPERLR